MRIAIVGASGKTGTKLVREQADWERTIIRAPTLRESEPAGYRFCRLAEVTAAHSLSRQDYAACLLDSIGNPEHHGRTLTAITAGG